MKTLRNLAIFVATTGILAIFLYMYQGKPEAQEVDPEIDDEMSLQAPPTEEEGKDKQEMAQSEDSAEERKLGKTPDIATPDKSAEDSSEDLIEPIKGLVRSFREQQLNPDQLIEELGLVGIQGSFKTKGHPKTGQRLELNSYPNNNMIQEFHAVYDLINDKPVFSSLRFTVADENINPEMIFPMLDSELEPTRSKGRRKVWKLSNGLVLILASPKGKSPTNNFRVFIEYPHEH